MSYQALYRTFRPTTLDGLVRQEHIVKILSYGRDLTYGTCASAGTRTFTWRAY